MPGLAGKTEQGYRGCMLLRFGNTLPRLVATLLAVVAVSLFFSASSAQHPAALHLAAVQDAGASHVHGHSHWDDALPMEEPDAPEHHHADHSHEKADLVAGAALPVRHTALSAYFSILTSPEGSRPDGIERPPRNPMNIA